MPYKDLNRRLEYGKAYRDSHKKETKKEKNIKLINCKRCNKEIEVSSLKTKYCSECVKLNKIEFDYNYRNTLRGSLKHLITSERKKHFKWFNLEELYYKQKGLCALSGVPMTTHSNMNKNLGVSAYFPTNISVDRIDSSKGYELNNIQLVCCIVNIMKNVLTEEQLVWWCKQIIKTQKAQI